MIQIKKAIEALKRAEGWYGLANSDFVRPWLYPALGALVTALSSIASALPLPYILAATSLVFAAVATALLRIDEWRVRRTPEHKIIVSDFVRANGDFKGGRFHLAFDVKNSADFPIEVIIEQVFVRSGNQFSKLTHQAPVVIAPMSSLGMVSKETTVIAEGDIRGTLYYRFKYGRQAKHNFALEGSFGFAISRGDQGDSLGSWFVPITDAVP